MLEELHAERGRWAAAAKQQRMLDVLGLLAAAGRPPVRSSGHYWLRLGELERLLEPYTRWTVADLDRAVKRSRPRLRWLARSRRTHPRRAPLFASPPAADAERARAFPDATIRQVAASLAWQAAGDDALDADRRAAEECHPGAPVVPSTLRRARHDWIARLASAR